MKLVEKDKEVQKNLSLYYPAILRVF